MWRRLRLITVAYLMVALVLGAAPFRRSLTEVLHLPVVTSTLAHVSVLADRGVAVLSRLNTQQPSSALNALDDAPATDDLSLATKCTLSAAEVDAILADAGSPAEGTGADWLAACERTKVDNAYLVAMFSYESSYGTNPSWAGNKGDGTSTHNIGNIICAGYSQCYGRFRDYASWKEGINDAADLLVTYREQYGHKTIGEALNTWAPPVENDTASYAAYVERTVKSWRSAKQTAAAGNKVVSTNIPKDGTAFQYNIASALDANKGALRRVEIKSGQRWSFNATLGPPWRIPNKEFAGQPGGGWCDLAARYLQVARKLGVSDSDLHFVHHGIQLNGVDWQDSISIWTTDGKAGSAEGRQDLEITNSSGGTLVFAVEETDTSWVVTGWKE